MGDFLAFQAGRKSRKEGTESQKRHACRWSCTSQTSGYAPPKGAERYWWTGDLAERPATQRVNQYTGTGLYSFRRYCPPYGRRPGSRTCQSVESHSGNKLLRGKLEIQVNRPTRKTLPPDEELPEPGPATGRVATGNPHTDRLSASKRGCAGGWNNYRPVAGTP